MTEPRVYEALTAGLVEGARARDGIAGLALVGSTSEAGAHRRDEWSDHDFFVVAERGRGSTARAGLDWLPDPQRIVLTAREGEVGFVVIYDDGHVLEFALAEPSELTGLLAGEATVVVDDAEATTAALIAQARDRATASDLVDPENDVRLALVKILIGVGRIRRGEVINGGRFIRTWAVDHLLRAIRGRFGGYSPDARDALDPTRRFEQDHPEWAEQITSALDQAPEAAARRLFALTREILEPGWAGFPSPAADTVARRLGWEDAA